MMGEATLPSLRDLVSEGLVKPGATLTGSHKGTLYEGKILKSGDIELADGSTGTPSGTAAKCTQTSVNGWRWWKLEGSPLSDVRRQRRK